MDWTDDLFWATGGFEPPSVVIGPGEKVVFQNADTYGCPVTITFDAGLQFTLQDGHRASVTFPSQTGVYNYKDDDLWGDSGTVIVAVPPTISITSPANNAVFPASATITFQATVSATSADSLSDVQFLLGTSDGTNVIADFSSPPYSVVTNLAAGVYTLIAVATDAYGLTSSDTITITVTAGPVISLGSPRFVSGKFLFDVNGLTVGATNLVQVSTNLASWAPVRTNIASSTAITVTNAAALGRGFFRIVQQP